MRIHPLHTPVRRFGAMLLAAGLAVSALSGCGTTTDPTGSATLGTSNDTNPQPRDQLRDGGNLRLAITAFPANWNTLSIDGNEGEIAEVLRPMMPRSFHTDAAGDTSVNHDYFTDIQLTSTDPQQVVYTINPKAVWSDGSPITWEDIAAQANALSGRDKRFLIAISNGFDRVAKVERGADDRQAVITFDRHYADWRGQFAGNSMLYPKSVTRDPEAFNRSLVDGVGLTAGPFLVQSTDRTQGRIVLARNPAWWGATPKLDTITFSVLDQTAWAAALQNNELDVARLSALDQVQMIRNTPGLVTRQAPDNRWRHLTFNGAPGALLADPALRVAISKAIDRKRIAESVQYGLVENPEPLGNHVYLQGQRGYRDNSLDYDPDAAARELDALGWVREGEIRVKDGRQLVIRDVMYNNPLWVQVAKFIQEDLARVGVGLTIDTRVGQGFFTDVIQPGDFDVAQFVFAGDAFPLSSVPQIYAYDPDDLQANFGRIGSPELNELIERTLSELDPDKAIELANQVDRAVFEEGHSLPLVQDTGIFGMRPEIANFGAPGLASYDYTKIGFLK
ncbi:Probable monoacyl phosphatidylinositol tetramannoside-binding protein LpqW precursor [Nocardia otitidiscaviarum]|uniref:Probable monoacyl phosphatidylinositol tetramannoside-binding protein LpqW n=1 Tax=Nocardia otitidiscaviarum TaxID=1823 RepID=A0A378YEU1_9NOCA|nr:ABC transporter family substrate-binding protein [Nocardia otitidiscaviarum]SUA74927.1 Probable monoacyl phosphatidylinositol tetramannoside-binding protein LpqW precursor [Nocardia otitidiscaviarum]